MMYYNYFNPFQGLYSAFGWIIFIFLIIFLLKATRGTRHPMNFHGHRDTAMDVLRERYAKGDISKEEFESRKKDLMSS